MKNLFFSIFLVCCVFNVNAQNSGYEPLQLKFGEIIEQGAITVEFNEVVTDSRCPKDVTCIWAGEVVILVTIKEKGKKPKQKKLTLSPTSQLQDLLGNLFTSEQLKLTGFNVLPYPNTRVKINKKDYCLEIQVN